MRKVLIAAVLIAALALPAQAAVEPAVQTEGCQVFNPVQPTCSYTATHDSDSPVQGIAGVGNWVVTIKVGKSKETYKSPAAGEPVAEAVTIPEGAKVTMKALTPGSGGTVGHAD